MTRFNSLPLLALLAPWAVLPAAAQGPAPTPGEADTSVIVVRISGIESAEGVVGCGLFARPDAFPMDSDGTLMMQEHRADPDGVTCRFEAVPAGTYAVSASHDRNRNGRTDTNLLGIPKEAWGVSNNVRPRMRAPRFEEAAFELAPGRTITLDVEVR
jgi:uncharacterized protein (DUF2141 family)